jgi:UPF0755 protein
MNSYKMYVKKPRRRSHWLIAILVVALLFVGASYGLRAWYNRNLAAVSSTQQITYFPVVKGSTVHEIAIDLARANLIRSTRAFETYVRGKSLFSSLQAGTYALSPSMSTPEIVDKMVKGDVAKNLVTILPGKTLKQIKQGFKESGYSDEELDKALDPATYPDIPLLENLPSGASLEGFLYPDSFQKEADTPAQTIIRQSIEEMQDHLTDDIATGFKARGLNPYQGITLASIVYQESGQASDQPTVAQVFLSRLKQGMMLGSDVTAFYAASQADAGKTLGVDSPYNTRIHTGLPPGPIGNMLDGALKAVAHPSKTDYLYFVAGDDGTIHFSHTQAEHEAAIAKYCHKECAQ